MIERPYQCVLDRIFRGVVRAKHLNRIARVAIAMALDQHRVLLDIAREHRPHYLAVRRRVLRIHPYLSPGDHPSMLDVMRDTGKRCYLKRVARGGLVTRVTWGSGQHL